MSKTISEEKRRIEDKRSKKKEIFGKKAEQKIIKLFLHFSLTAFFFSPPSRLPQNHLLVPLVSFSFQNFFLPFFFPSLSHIILFLFFQFPPPSCLGLVEVLARGSGGRAENFGHDLAGLGA